MRYRLYAFFVIAILATSGASHAASTAKSKAKPKTPAKTVTAVKPKPGPPAKTFKPTCQKDFCDSLLRFHRRTIVEAYAQHGTHDPKWEDKVATFLDSCARGAARVDAPQLATVLAQAKELLDLGCTDPLVISLCGGVLYLNKSEAQAQSLLEKALVELPKSGYCKWRAAVIPNYLLCINNDTGCLTPDERTAVERQQVSLIAEALRDGSYKPGESRIQLWNLLSVVDAEHRDAVAAELAKNPRVDKYALNVFKGQSEIDNGWADRGTGYASEVTEQGWKGFEEHLTAARKLLTDAWKLHPEYPEAPCLMIKVTMAGLGNPGDTERLWFNRATAAQFDYLPAYNSLRWALRPRWGGSLEELYQHGVTCLQTKRFDTEVPWEFFQSLLDITTDLEGKKSYWLKPDTEKHLEALYDGYTKSRPDKLDRFSTFRAATAWYVGDYKKAKTLLDDLGDRADETVFSECFKTTREFVRTESAVLGGPQAPRLQAAAVLYKSGRFAEALAAYEAIRTDAKDDSAVSRFIRDTTAPIAIEGALSMGDWADLRASTDLVEWHSKYKGSWSVEPDGTIVLTPPDNAGPELLSRARFGTRFEIRGQVEFGYEYRRAFVAFRHPTLVLYACLDRSNKEVSVCQGFAKRLQHEPVELGEKNDFLVRYRDGRISIHVDGKPAIEDFDCDIRRDQPMEVGVGAFVFGDEPVLKFRNLQVRKLPAQP